MKRLSNYHTKHLKEVYGEGIFFDKKFHMNYGWGVDDDSITTKIYKKGGNEFLTTFFVEGRYVYDCGKL
jgi:hypothetical protein